MKIIKIQRNSYRKDCTLGILYDADGDALYATLEEPDMGNTTNISCIPEGQYTCKPHISTKFPYPTWEITNVPNRTAVLIGHKGNTVLDIEGCILMGRNFGKLKGRTAVLSSGIACEGFQKYIGIANEFILQIERI